MTDHTTAAQAAPHEAVLTDGEILQVFADVVGNQEDDARFIDVDRDQAIRIARTLLSKLRAPVASAEVTDALNWVDDFIARCNRDDRGSCEPVNILRRALASAPVAGEAQPVAWFIDWPDEPELGHYIAESPSGYGRSRPLVFADAAPQARPSDDDLWDQTLKERDHYHDMADRLANAIGAYFGQDAGEHSSSHCPWHEALGIIGDAAPQVSEVDAAAFSTAVDYRRMEDTQVGASEHLAKLAAALGNRDWKWWDSCSFRRLTFADGPDRRDGGALCGWVQPSDGHPDVSMAPGVREFIEAASPKAIAALAAAYMATMPSQPEQS